MAELILQLKGVELWRFPIAKTQTTIGRDAENDVVIDNQAVSRVHATVGVVDGLFLVVDCGSSNGTLLNGKQVERAALSDGDLLTIGKHTVVFKEAGGLPVEGLLPREEADVATRKSLNIVETAVIRREDVFPKGMPDTPEQQATRPPAYLPPTADSPRWDGAVVTLLAIALIAALGVIAYMAVN